MTVTARGQLASAGGRLEEDSLAARDPDCSGAGFFLRQPAAPSNEASWRPFEHRGGGGSSGSDEAGRKRQKGRKAGSEGEPWSWRVRGDDSGGVALIALIRLANRKQTAVAVIFWVSV